MSWNEDLEFLEKHGWVVECESPFEISTPDGSSASGEAAYIVLNDLKSDHIQRFNEQDMKDCFGAGVNRGVSLAAKILKRDIDEEFPPFSKYMEKYNEDEG